MLLTSSAFVKPYSVLWRIEDTLEQHMEFPEECFVDFTNRSALQIVGTQGPKATVDFIINDLMKFT